MTKNATTEVQFSWRNLDFVATGIYTPGDPGRYSGPPEKCHPAEAAEFEVQTLTCEGKDAMFLLDSTFAEEIMDHIVEAYEADLYHDDEPPDMTDVEADADTLRSAGYGTDEDYGLFDDHS